MFAATAAGIYNRVEEAMEVMGQGFDAEYQPNKELVGIYEKIYQQYKTFGGFIEAQIQEALNKETKAEAKKLATA